MDSRSLLAARDALEKVSLEEEVKKHKAAGGNRLVRRKDASKKKRDKRKKGRAFRRKEGKQQKMPQDVAGTLTAIVSGAPLEDMCGHGRYRGIACPWCTGVNTPVVSDEARRLSVPTMMTAMQCQEVVDACYDLEITAETLIDCELRLQLGWRQLLEWHRQGLIRIKGSGE